MNELLDQYDAEVRANPVAAPCMKVVRDGYVTRLEGAFNFVCSWKLSHGTVLQAVRKQARHFRRLREELIWRVYDHDEPSNIEACLRQEG